MPATMSFDTQIRGALFTKGVPLSNEFITRAKEALADAGVNLVLAQLAANLQNPTGRYESRIGTEKQVDDIFVTDDGMIYGPWLEGTGSRNKTTKFKGYASFRKASQQLERQVDRIVDKELKLFLSRLES